jgi:aryl-alcohol dehydrogenase-like predicted oxidoreductase
MDPSNAVLTVLREEGVPLHWTKVQDLALRRGYLDPFEQPDIRRRVLSALAQLVREGVIRKVGTGVYEVPD